MKAENVEQNKIWNFQVGPLDGVQDMLPSACFLDKKSLSVGFVLGKKDAAPSGMSAKETIALANTYAAAANAASDKFYILQAEIDSLKSHEGYSEKELKRLQTKQDKYRQDHSIAVQAYDNLLTQTSNVNHTIRIVE